MSDRHAAMGELEWVVTVAMGTDSDEVKAFAMLALARLAALSKGGTPLRYASEDEVKRSWSQMCARVDYTRLKRQYPQVHGKRSFLDVEPIS